jgi:hypothetical protein
MENLISSLKNVLFKKVWKYFSHHSDLLQNSDLFGKAKEIKIYAGEMYPEFYNDINLLHNIKRSIQSGCNMSIVFGPALSVNSNKFLRLACKEKNISIFKRNHRDPGHFKIIKNINGEIYAIIDKPHDISTDFDNKRSILLLKGFEKEINYFEEKFYKAMIASTRVNHSNVIDEFYQRGFENCDFYGFISKRDDRIMLATDEEIDRLMTYIHN